jgi:hypothetical protein
LLPGGRGGRGNSSFKTGRNKAPQLAENGEEGAEMSGPNTHDTKFPSTQLEHDVIYLNQHNHKFSYDDNLDIGFAACLGFRD